MVFRAVDNDPGNKLLWRELMALGRKRLAEAGGGSEVIKPSLLDKVYDRFLNKFPVRDKYEFSEFLSITSDQVKSAKSPAEVEAATRLAEQICQRVGARLKNNPAERQERITRLTNSQNIMETQADSCRLFISRLVENDKNEARNNPRDLNKWRNLVFSKFLQIKNTKDEETIPALYEELDKLMAQMTDGLPKDPQAWLLRLNTLLRMQPYFFAQGSLEAPAEYYAALESIAEQALKRFPKYEEIWFIRLMAAEGSAWLLPPSQAGNEAEKLSKLRQTAETQVADLAALNRKLIDNWYEPLINTAAEKAEVKNNGRN